MGYIATREEFQEARWDPCGACKGTGNATGQGELRPVPPHPPGGYVK